MALHMALNGRAFCWAIVWWIAAGSSASIAAVTMSYSATAPTTGPKDQFDFTDTAAIPGGTAPGGGTYNSQVFADNGGPPGQIFTTPTGASTFVLKSVSLKGADTGGANSGGGIFNTGTPGACASVQ